MLIHIHRNIRKKSVGISGNSFLDKLVGRFEDEKWLNVSGK